jgi:hypothetical protein
MGNNSLNQSMLWALPGFNGFTHLLGEITRAVAWVA